MKHTLVALLLLIFSSFSQATVILVYHHVSTKTPKSTSISPKQFDLHLQYLKDNGFTVIALNELVDNLKQQKPLTDKTVVITFDDGYGDILQNGHPLLKKYGYPYTMFINPKTVPNKGGMYLDWQQIKQMSDEGVLIANHGLVHDSLIKAPQGHDAKQWLSTKLEELQQAEQMIKDKTGQNWQYFALPYGEYTVDAQVQLEKMGYAVFTQQSGPVGLSTDLTAIPRFPASMPYDQLGPLKDKLNSLAFNISVKSQRSATIVANGALPDTKVEIEVKDFYSSMLACFISSSGKAEIVWQDNKQSFTMNMSGPLKTGRNRSNCTAPSISHAGRYYWLSKPWFVPKPDGSWYSD
ncbi:polysaccharide deacetylase family protein [Colwelliaceae bacterium BS250]